MGKLISIDGTLKDTVGVKNPYRYRGYRYDTETGLYYLCCVWIGNGCYYIYGETLENFDKATLDTNTFKNLSKSGFDY